MSSPIRRMSLVAVVAALVLSSISSSAAAGEIRIVRDRFGVPHVYGATAEDVAYGAGYALAQDRL